MDALALNAPLVQGVRVGVELQGPVSLRQSLEHRLVARHFKSNDLLSIDATFFSESVFDVQLLCRK